MKSFRDSTGRSWDVIVDGETIVRVKGLCGVLLTDMISGSAANDLAADPIRFMGVLYAVCKPQADERDVGETAFRKLLTGDVIEEATDALVDAVVDFFPKSRREVAQKLVSKGREAQALATRRVNTQLDALTPEMILDKSPGNAFGNSPELSESTLSA